MTKLQTELREILLKYGYKATGGIEPAHGLDDDEATAAITDLFTHLISEAKPEKIKPGELPTTPIDYMEGHSKALDEYEQSLLNQLKGNV